MIVEEDSALMDEPKLTGQRIKYLVTYLCKCPDMIAWPSKATSAYSPKSGHIMAM